MYQIIKKISYLINLNTFIHLGFIWKSVNVISKSVLSL